MTQCPASTPPPARTEEGGWECLVVYVQGSLYIVRWSSSAAPTGLCESVIEQPCTLMCQLVSNGTQELFQIYGLLKRLTSPQQLGHVELTLAL